MKSTRTGNVYGCCCFLLLLTTQIVFSKEAIGITHSRLYHVRSADSVLKDSANVAKKDSGSVKLKVYGTIKNPDSLKISSLAKFPLVSLQQLLKSNVSGIYVAETSGEPGSASQSMMIRGLTMPISGNKDVLQLQPAVYVNGIPLIPDNPFLYDIKKYDFNAVGPATNLLATIEPDNIESIKVLKGPAAIAIYGPRAANGAIFITTKNAQAGKSSISVNSYFGRTQKDAVTSINASYENDFRQPFYSRFASVTDQANYPAYLRDATNANYYGSSNWTDLYYQNTNVYGINASLTGGSKRSNFRFFAGSTKNSGTADSTSLSKYNAAFFINMLPVKWLTVSSMLSVTRLERDRNKNFRDRFAEMQYLPDLTSPIAPTKEIYGNFLDEYTNKSFDKNKTNSITGSFSLNANFRKLNFISRVAFDYNEGIRDLFYPGTLLDGNNYVSDFYGYNQRFIIDNTLTGTQKLNSASKLNFEFGQSFQGDVNKYNYSVGYKGSSDYIRINEVEGNSTESDYLVPADFLTFRYTDRLKSNLSSLHSRTEYVYRDLLTLGTVLRADGASNIQPGNRWFFSPEVDADFNLKSALFVQNDRISKLSLTAAWGKLGSLISSDRFAAGPQYTVDLGWSSNPSFYSYAGFGTLSRPYSTGWVGYDIPWQYSEELNVGLNAGLFKNRLEASITVYTRNNKNTLFAMPVNAESGYAYQYMSGLDVNNKGIEAALGGKILQSKKGINFTSSLNLTHNRNKLAALPGGLSEIVYGSQKLVVGEATDRFWVLENEGTFQKDVDVPVNPSNYEILNYKGLAFKGGDPRWKDQNGDYVINDDDKVFKGNYLPKVYGGFNNEITYRKLSLDVNFYFALGRTIQNQAVANRFDFINREGQQDISSVKEIFYWQKNFDASGYPVYNPWSAVQPYRADQDMFLENGSFLKLRTLSLSYDLTRLKAKPAGRKLERALVYVTATNLFTLTPYSGRDPELVSYTGIDTGYGLSIPKTYTIGFKVDL